MYDYSYVLELLRVHAAEHRSRALLGQRAEIENRTTERTLRLNVHAADARYDLNGVTVSVNGVPVDGANGTGLRGHKTRTWEQEVAVELCSGLKAAFICGHRSMATMRCSLVRSTSGPI